MERSTAIIINDGKLALMKRHEMTADTICFLGERWNLKKV